MPRSARRHRCRCHHRVYRKPQPRVGIRRHRAPRRHRHRVGAGTGQPVGAGHRVGTRDADVVAALTSWRCQAGGRRRPSNPRDADTRSATGIRDGRGTVVLHPTRGSARTGRPHPGPAAVRRRRTTHRRRSRRTGRGRQPTANYWFAVPTPSTDTSPPKPTTRAPSTRKASTAAATWSDSTPMATWKSPAE